MVVYKYLIKIRTSVRCLETQDDETDIKGFLATPEKTKNVLLFPKSQCKIYRWNKHGTLEFFISVFIVIGTLFDLVKLY